MEITDMGYWRSMMVSIDAARPPTGPVAKNVYFTTIGLTPLVLTGGTLTNGFADVLVGFGESPAWKRYLFIASATHAARLTLDPELQVFIKKNRGSFDAAFALYANFFLPIGNHLSYAHDEINPASDDPFAQWALATTNLCIARSAL